MSEFLFQSGLGSSPSSVSGTTAIPGYTLSVVGIVNAYPTGATIIPGYTASVLSIIPAIGCTNVVGFTAGVNEAYTLPTTNRQLSSSCGSFSTTSNSYVDVTNLSLSIYGTGRPIMLALIDAGSDNSYVRANSAGGSYVIAYVEYVRGSSGLGPMQLSTQNTAGTPILDVPVGAFNKTDIPSAGTTHTYKVRSTVAFEGGSSPSLAIGNVKLEAIAL